MITPTESCYKRVSLYQTEEFENASCEWMRNSSSSTHAHGWSECYVLVQSGVFENTTHLGIKTETTQHEPGQVIITPAGAAHQIKCISETGKTLHVYVPKISEHLKETRLAPQSVAQLHEGLDLALKNDGANWSQFLAAAEKIQAHSLPTYSPVFMNQLFSGVAPEMILAEEILAKTRTTMATFEASPAFTLVEMEVIQQLGHLIGWTEKDCEGITVPGGSAANFMALHCARQRQFPNYKTDGMPIGAQVKIFVSEDAHYSFKKACAALGFGTNALVAVKTDSKGQMLVTDLAEKIADAKKQKQVPLLVCATAGTTVLGAFDPIEHIYNVCKEDQIWLHVDGAWGGPVLFSESQKEKVRGIHLADSVTFDAHKLFGASLTCSFFITRDPKILLAANDVSGADYLFHDGAEVIDRGRLSWQCGRKAEAMSFWAIWKSAGTKGLGLFVDRLMQVQPA